MNLYASKVDDLCEDSEILIIDDDQLNVTALSTLLEQLNLASSFATSGHEALRMVKERLENDELQMFKLILCDFSMPGMNGFECADSIKALVA